MEVTKSYSVGVFVDHSEKKYAIFNRNLHPSSNSNFKQNTDSGKWFDPRWPTKEFYILAECKTQAEGEHLLFAQCAMLNNIGYTKTFVKHDI